MINKKGLLITLGISSVLVLGMFVLKTNNNKEISLAELETNSFINESNSTTFIADSEDETANAEELAEKYLKREDIEIFNEKETQELDSNISETQLFQEPNLNPELTEIKELETTESMILETETQVEETVVDLEVKNVQTFTSSMSLNEKNIVTETAPIETEPVPVQETETAAPVQETNNNIDYKESIYTVGYDEMKEIENKGLELLKIATENGINTNGVENSISILQGNASFEPNGQEKYIEIKKDYENNCYNVNIHVTVGQEESALNNMALRQLCKLISYNNDNVFNTIMNDYNNNVYPTPNTWYDTEHGFKIMGYVEKGLVRYSIKY